LTNHIKAAASRSQINQRWTHINLPSSDIKQSQILKSHVEKEPLDKISLPLVVGEDYLFNLLEQMKEEDKTKKREMAKI
jgi:hypothetical protein